MALKDEACSLIVALKPRLWVRPCPSDEFLPPTEDDWFDLGCLENFSTTTDETYRDVPCLGDFEPIARFLQSSSKVWNFGAKCLNPTTIAILQGGGEIITSPDDPAWCMLIQDQKSPPELSFFLEFQNSLCYTDPATGAQIQSSYGFWVPRASLSSSFDFDLGTAGTPTELIISATINILSAPVDPLRNPGGNSCIPFSNDPAWKELAGTGPIVAGIGQ